MSEPVFRRASTDDAAAIAEVTAEVVSGPNPVGIDEPLSVPQAEQWLERLGDAGAIFLAELDGAVAGFGALDFDTQPHFISDAKQFFIKFSYLLRF